MVHSQNLFSEEMLFAQGIRAGEFAFTAQDARRSYGELNDTSAQDQALRTVENLGLALKNMELDLESVVSLMVYLPEYSDAAQVAQVLKASLGKNAESYPATTLVGVAGLEGGCRVRIDAVATSSRDREAFRLMDLPLALGSRCHGARVGNFFFLSGVDAADGEGNVLSPATIQAQTPEILGRINKILNAQGLSLGDLCRTFMFMPSTDYRPGYGEARKKVYKGIFAEDEFPPNSGIYIRDLGPDILLRSIAVRLPRSENSRCQPQGEKSPGFFFAIGARWRLVVACRSGRGWLQPRSGGRGRSRRANGSDSTAHKGHFGRSRRHSGRHRENDGLSDCRSRPFGDSLLPIGNFSIATAALRGCPRG